MMDASQMPRSLKIWASWGVIMAACLLLYGQSLRFAFTSMDDDFIINNIVDRGKPISEAFISDATMARKGSSFYRPLQTVTYQHDAHWSGKGPIAYHVSNLIIFCLACCTLLSLLLALGTPHGQALAGSLIFTVHPLFAQAAAWIPARGDLLFALFGMLSMIALVRYRASGSLISAATHLATFGLATLSKETALMLLPPFAIYLLTAGRSADRRTGRIIPLLPGWGVVAGGFLALRSIAVHGVPDKSSFGISVLAGNLATIPETVANLFWPVNIGVLPSFTFWRTVVGSLLIGIIFALSLRQRRQSWPLILLGSSWFVGLTLPGMLFRHELGRFAYDYLHHRSFLPLVGLLIILLQLLPASWSPLSGKRQKIALLLLLASLSLLSFRQARAYSDPFTFYDEAIRENPQSAFSLTNRGSLKARRGDFKGAIADYDRALSIVPSYYLALSNRGTSRGEAGDFDGAIRDLTAAIRQQPAYPDAYNLRGLWRYRAKDYSGATADYDAALRLDPDNAPVYCNRGILRATEGDDAAALRDFAKAIELNPYIAETWINLGRLSLRQGAVQDACVQLRNARTLGHREADGLLQQYCR